MVGKLLFATDTEIDEFFRSWVNIVLIENCKMKMNLHFSKTKEKLSENYFDEEEKSSPIEQSSPA